MQIVIAGLQSVSMYVDDAIVFNRTPSLHVQSIREFLARLEEHNFKLAPAKATIGATKVAFLGHDISPSGVRPDPNKVEAPAQIPIPLKYLNYVPSWEDYRIIENSFPTWPSDLSLSLIC